MRLDYIKTGWDVGLDYVESWIRLSGVSVMMHCTKLVRVSHFLKEAHAFKLRNVKCWIMGLQPAARLVVLCGPRLHL